MPRAPRPDDLYALRVPMELAISPDGRQVCFAVKSVAPARDGYRQALWMVPADGSTPPRQVTLGARNDTAPRWSADGRQLAFLSDRSGVLQKAGAGPAAAPEEAPKDGGVQVWVLFMDGGEARQVTTLPSDARAFAWSPDGRRLCVESGATRATEKPEDRKPTDPPKPDARLIDRLGYQHNGVGFIHEKPSNLWLIDLQDGAPPRRLTGGRSQDRNPAWSPDGRRIAFESDRHPDADLTWRTDIYLLDLDGGRVRRVTGGRGERAFGMPAWSPDGTWIAVLGHRFGAGAASRADVWRFRPRAEQAGENLTGETDLMVGSGMSSDLFGGDDPRIHWSADGRSVVFSAPIEGSYEMWRVDAESKRVDRLTTGQHHLSRHAMSTAAGPATVAAVRATGAEPPDVVAFDLLDPTGGPASELRRLSDLMGDAWGDVEITAPVERWHEVDGRRIQGWFVPARSTRSGPAPAVLEIHGGPATLYGWSLFWEWQCLAAAGMSVYACNPRGSQGYGEAFCHANFGDWGDGPMRDVIGGIDSLVADGLADPARLGVTGGSYGGYLTSWIVGHTERFAAAVTCRSVNDMTSQMLSGDIAGPQFGRLEYGANPWEDPLLYHRHSPLTYAERIRTPLLIQHAEKDLRCTITQAEELFTVLRSLKRPVRLMRTPEESHELTRSGTPFRRVENAERIRDWFRHFLVAGKKNLPPI